MADGHRRPGELNEARDDYYRVYPIKGTWFVGAIVVVNADGDLEFTVATTGDALVDEVSGEILIDEVSGEVLYDG